MTDHLFLTGATGFIGSHLLRKWLENTSARITVLVRPLGGISPQDRLQSLLAGFSSDRPHNDYLKRISLVEGDLMHPQIGLMKTEYQRLIDSVTLIVHCGAAVRFSLDHNQANQTNILGTKETLALAKQCRNLQRFYYLSTAYVAGNRTGIIKEDELDEGQKHNNSYERSKFEAEKIVSAAMKELPIVILRPSIVVGDTKTGELSTNGAFYRLLSMYMKGQLNCLPGNPDANLDLVPVEYIADGIYALANGNGSFGRCFHMTAGSENVAPLAQLVKFAGRYAGKAPLLILPPEEFKLYVRSHKHGNDMNEDMKNEIKMYLPYLTSDLQFDKSNANIALKGTGIQVPHFETYFGKILDFIKMTN